MLFLKKISIFMLRNFFKKSSFVLFSSGHKQGKDNPYMGKILLTCSLNNQFLIIFFEISKNNK
jgi:hypothetical protein